jgi:cytosine/adenosine deaminase-related metal-dependent hydrolase
MDQGERRKFWSEDALRFHEWFLRGRASIHGRFALHLANATRYLPHFFKAGVPIVAGSDTPTGSLVPGRSLIEELERLHRAGLPRTAVLQSATINAARLLRRADLIGSLAAGKIADVVVVRDDPTQDLSTLWQPEVVIHDGRVIDREALSRIPPRPGALKDFQPPPKR